MDGLSPAAAASRGARSASLISAQLCPNERLRFAIVRSGGAGLRISRSPCAGRGRTATATRGCLTEGGGGCAEPTLSAQGPWDVVFLKNQQNPRTVRAAPR